jgi:single-stranded-DNA-specific exonuclease
VNPIIKVRDVPPRTAFLLEQAGVHPLLARLFAARGVRSSDDLDDQPARLLPPDGLHGAAAAGVLLADAIEQGQRICVVADYDCDGATACATALRGLALLGAPPGALNYVVPDRQVHGYGLTPAIVDMAQAHRPDVLVTVDNGIASHEGVAHARALGLKVLVTDHHLPAMRDGQPTLPPANVIVNPNQPGCGFNSKAIAGVGVMFYTLLATRAELRRRGRWDAASQPRLDALLDLVALGTVADVVRLDANNRRLVAQGLKRIRAGRMQPGVAALYHAAARDATRASAFDFGFALGPRVNAAGRLSDMRLGIECLLTDDAGRAAELAGQLDAINRERREVEAGMREQAQLLLDARMPEGEAPPALVLFDPEFHEGVVGIVAGRMKDRLHRPTFVFARGADGLLKGSGRSIAGFHLRDALDLVSKRHPGLLRRFWWPTNT